MKKILLFLCCLTCLGPASGAVYADTFWFDPANTFSGTAPTGYLQANFTDVAGGVQLVITSNLTAGENLDPGKALYLNFNPALNNLLSKLTFTLQGNTNFSQAAGVQTGANAFKADGDGYYDIMFTYNPSTKAFTSGQSQTYLITSAGGVIHAGDFTQFYSSPGGGAGTWLAAIHVQNTPSGGGSSGWVAGTGSPVPIPGAVWLLGTGLAGLGVFRNRINRLRQNG